MKKILLIVLFLFLIGSGFLLITRKKNYSAKSSGKTISYSLQGKTYRLLTAKTSVEWQKGLMNVRDKNDFDGMIFIFPDKQFRSFWNKNTYRDLDLYWFDDERIVGQSFLPSIEKSKNIVFVSSPTQVNRVIEIIR